MNAYGEIKRLILRIQGRGGWFVDRMLEVLDNNARVLHSAEARNLRHIKDIEHLANWMREAVAEPGLPDEMKKRGAALLKNLERSL
ncbi:MAG: hypothetical protein SVS15_11345 [Thermodesulfobacteriota bacterium]|nr:hypothetical protein [Thermodesulfobacteriota bacterium]